MVRNLLSNWGVPAALLTAWAIAAAFTLHKLSGLQNIPVMTAPAVEITSGNAGRS